jgi:nucleoside-diphosphate-sugar epimerase
MARLLIIGGSGFFGKSILDSYKRGLLKEFGINSITILARNAEFLLHSTPYLLDDTVTLINDDIGKCQELPFAEYIIHAAASTDVKNYISQSTIERRNILSGVLNFCNLAPKYLRESKILYVSSGAIYGYQPADIMCLEEDSKLGLIESLPPSKQDYAIAKRESEQAVIALGKFGLNVSIARCFAFVGKYLPRDQSFAIGNFIADGMAGRMIKVNSHNVVSRSYLYADDLVAWLMKIAMAGSPMCPIFNVGSDEEVSIQELSIMVANQFSAEYYYPTIESQVVDRYIPCIKKAKSIGCEVENSLESAIYKTIYSLRGYDWSQKSKTL